MSDQPKRRKALIVADFTDAGTGERFTAGAEPMLDAGAFANYEAAGLVTAPVPAAPRATPKPRTRRKPAPKAPAPAPAPLPVPATEASDPAA
jgi:hypothetical protein